MVARGRYKPVLFVSPVSADWKDSFIRVYVSASILFDMDGIDSLCVSKWGYGWDLREISTLA